MFTGLVQGTGLIDAIDYEAEITCVSIQFSEKLLNKLVTGASVAVNGCCLTVTQIQDNLVTFEVIPESLRCTNLKRLKAKHLINLERSAQFGDEIGGHLLSGHIMTELPINRLQHHDHFTSLTLPLDPQIKEYVFYKGYIAIDGVSLTVTQLYANEFEVHLIPETLSRTIANQYQAKQWVNIEIDSQTQIIVDTIKNHYSPQQRIYKTDHPNKELKK